MGLDEAVFYAINGLAGRSPLLDQAALALSRAGTVLWPGALAAAYWFWTRRREALIAGPALVALIVVADFLGAQLKQAVARGRPCRVLPDVRELAGCGATFGFPSNHAVNSAAAAAFLQVLYPATGWVSWPLVAMIGFARIYVGAHFLSDVLGGWLLGGLVGAGVALWLLRRPEFGRKVTSGTAASGPVNE